MKIIVENNKKNTIGRNLKNIRESRKITQAELSAKLELIGIYIDRASISKIESQVRIVTDFELLAFSKILNVDIKELIDEKFFI